jgi:18S rRNA (guanine1575-N7)-methyltransferase
MCVYVPAVARGRAQVRLHAFLHVPACTQTFHNLCRSRLVRFSWVLIQFYNREEASKYATNSRMREIQTSLTERALELLALPTENCFVLDVGCGSGLSGECITESGHQWIGCDISKDMLMCAKEQEVEGDVMVNDMGQGLPFRPGSFDGCISISAVQWLCNADRSDANPYRRLLTFFTSLYRSLVRGGRAVLQFYPENTQQMELVTSCAMRCGFSGGLLVDYPNSTRAKKYFLVIYAGQREGQVHKEPKALGVDEGGAHGVQTQVGFEKRRERNFKKQHRGAQKDISAREWVQNKKSRQRAQGKQVVNDSKYTARKRRPKF